MPYLNTSIMMSTVYVDGKSDSMDSFTNLYLSPESSESSSGMRNQHVLESQPITSTTKCV